MDVSSSCVCWRQSGNRRWCRFNYSNSPGSCQVPGECLAKQGVLVPHRSSECTGSPGLAASGYEGSCCLVGTLTPTETFQAVEVVITADICPADNYLYFQSKYKVSSKLCSPNKASGSFNIFHMIIA